MLDRITPPEVRPFGHLSLPPMKRIVLDNGIILNVYDHSFQDVSELMLLTPGGMVEAIGVACRLNAGAGDARRIPDVSRQCSF